MKIMTGLSIVRNVQDVARHEKINMTGLVIVMNVPYAA
jgi:hypothetical protein